MYLNKLMNQKYKHQNVNKQWAFSMRKMSVLEFHLFRSREDNSDKTVSNLL